MPDILDATGLQVKTSAEIRADLEAGMRAIYGDDINLDQNSPDGQLVGIFTQAATDIRELIMGVYNSFNPDRAIGVLQDERFTINNIARQGGSFTIVPISLTVDRTLTLTGLDGNAASVDGTGYTVQDDAGNRFILLDTTTITVGTTALNFRAQQIGLVETTVGTITNPVTIVLGVTGINNPVGNLQTGADEETDQAYRLRRQRSMALSSTGYLNGLDGAVRQLDGVTDVRLYENVGNATDASGIPAHAIWLIVEGGANADIANEIYARKSAGSDMKGAVTVPIATPAGGTFTARFDRPLAKALYIRYDIKKTSPTASFDLAAIRQYMVGNLDYNIGDFAETSAITAVARAAIMATSGAGVPINVEISKDGTNWLDYLAVDLLNEQWVLDASRITVTVVT